MQTKSLYFLSSHVSGFHFGDVAVFVNTDLIVEWGDGGSQTPNPNSYWRFRHLITFSIRKKKEFRGVRQKECFLRLCGYCSATKRLNRLDFVRSIIGRGVAWTQRGPLDNCHWQWYSSNMTLRLNSKNIYGLPERKLYFSSSSSSVPSDFNNVGILEVFQEGAHYSAKLFSNFGYPNFWFFDQVRALLLALSSRWA